MLDLPHPLAARDPVLRGACRRAVLLEEHLRAPAEEDEEEAEGNDGPDDLEDVRLRVRLVDVLADLALVGAPVPDHEDEDEPRDERREDDEPREGEEHEVVDGPGDVGRLLGQQRGARDVRHQAAPVPRFSRRRSVTTRPATAASVTTAATRMVLVTTAV